MQLHFLGKAGSKTGDCPTLYATDRATYVVQGWRTGAPEMVEIPHLLLGFSGVDTFIDAALTDTRRGTFRLSGRPVTESETLQQLDLADDEAAIEVPMTRRNFYGGIAAE